MKNKNYTLKYRRFRISNLKENPRKPECEVCGKKGKIDAHHYKYEFTTKEVRKNKALALKNTISLCYKCHQVADEIGRAHV